MKGAEFHREAAKGEADEEKRKERIQEVLLARHGSSLELRRYTLDLTRMRTELLWGEKAT